MDDVGVGGDAVKTTPASLGRFEQIMILAAMVEVMNALGTLDATTKAKLESHLFRNRRKRAAGTRGAKK